jgi:CRP-like cAMP-binding protein
MHAGAKPKIRIVEQGDMLTMQGDAATDVYLILDGMFLVEIDGREVGEIGPGAVVGERAALEGGVRTATLRATTRARIAEASPDQLNPVALETVAGGHRREDAPRA